MNGTEFFIGQTATATSIDFAHARGDNSTVRMLRRVFRTLLSKTSASEDLLKVYLIPRFTEWRKQYFPTGTPAFGNKRQLWDFVLKKHANDPVTLLEFGVFRGRRSGISRKLSFRRSPDFMDSIPSPVCRRTGSGVRSKAPSIPRERFRKLRIRESHLSEASFRTRCRAFSRTIRARLKIRKCSSFISTRTSILPRYMSLHGYPPI